MIAGHTRATRSLAHRARVNAFVRMHSRSCCGRSRLACRTPHACFSLLLFSFHLSLSPLSLSLFSGPSPPALAFLSSLYVIAPRPADTCPSENACGDRSERRQVGLQRSRARDRIRPDRNCADRSRSEIHFATIAPSVFYVLSSDFFFFHLFLLPFRSGTWSVRWSRFQRGSMRRSLISKVRLQKRL